VLFNKDDVRGLPLSLSLSLSLSLIKRKGGEEWGALSMETRRGAGGGGGGRASARTHKTGWKPRRGRGKG